jgi:hypothetical protein
MTDDEPTGDLSRFWCTNCGADETFRVPRWQDAVEIARRRHASLSLTRGCATDAHVTVECLERT